MATRLQDLVEYGTVEPIVRPALRLVDARLTPKPMPPAWMVAPAFRVDAEINALEPQAVRHSAAVPLNAGPFQSVRQVPRTTPQP